MVEGAYDCAISPIHPWIIDGVIEAIAFLPNRGSTCSLYKDSYLISDAGSTTRDASYRCPSSANVVRPAFGSM